MRRLGRVLPVAGASIVIGLTAGAAWGSPPPPGWDYHWAQPGTAAVATPGAQPPAWVPIAVYPVAPAVAGSDYRWAQPGTAPVDAPYAQPPAFVPVA